MSLQTLTDATSYDGKGYSTFGFEYEPGRDGRVTWAMNQTQTWQLNAAAMGFVRPTADCGPALTALGRQPKQPHRDRSASRIRGTDEHR